MPDTYTEPSALEVVVRRAKLEILEDIKNNIVPPDVKSFSALHDYVDANGYGGAFEVSEIDFDFWNRVQNEVHEWIVAGMPHSPCTCHPVVANGKIYHHVFCKGVE